MVGIWVKVIAAIVIVWILIFILYFAYDGFQCQTAQDRYEQSVGSLNITENTGYLTEYQEACHTK
jgi:predicted negative regulator of RcsB-dependent stress response